MSDVENMETPESSGRVEDLTKYIILCEVTETKDDGNKQSNFMNLFAKSGEEALLKVLTAQNLMDKPNTSIKVVGTYIKTKLEVVNKID